MSSGKGSGERSANASGAGSDRPYSMRLVGALIELGLSTSGAVFLASAIQGAIKRSVTGPGRSNLHCCFSEGRLISTSESFTPSSAETGPT